MSGKKDSVRVFEVGARDGLQNESRVVSFEQKIEFVNGLIGAGVQALELGAFVHPEWVPQMTDTDALFAAVHSKKIKAGKKTELWALVPNMRGLERAMAVGVDRIAIFTAASETFTKKNIGKSIAESLHEYREVTTHARKWGMKVRGYISTVFGCPFEGKIAPSQALKVISQVAKLGVDEISLGDTIGVATPGDVDQVIPKALKAHGSKKIAVHFHDTRGTSLANSLRSIEHGVRIVDSSAGGLGGCPYAPGATGNLATEDLVYMLDGMGVATGIDLKKLAQTSARLHQQIGRPVSSRYLQAFLASSKKGSKA